MKLTSCISNPAIRQGFPEKQILKNFKTILYIVSHLNIGYILRVFLYISLTIVPYLNSVF